MDCGDLLQNWMESRFGPGLELIATYVDDIEKECERSIAEFRQSSDGYEKSAGFDEAGNEQTQWVSCHKGLSDDAWCLPEIFEHHFPTAKRGAALTALCGYMEHELNELCREIKCQILVTVSVEDMKGQGVTRAELYLRKVGNVAFDDRLKADWRKMQDVFLVRNSIVHAGGRTEKENVQQIVKTSPFLESCDGLIDIHAGYLRSVIDIFDATGRAIDVALKARFGPRKLEG
ncbi:hypothetical protein DF134_19410 [Burkholderia stagnalis]|uniref:hypothetical protein n=1 Tax=Burkholderia stagnalis TaxID=1503054 RepID=UPI000F5B40F6|nr:hypothetical protein [Burkholderia stagnalis]RQQ88739.1 hypothetical protein DF134_19410 [Burkholderia stagnalis]